MIETAKRVHAALGRTLATPGVMKVTTQTERNIAVTRHSHGDWGDVGKEDWQANDQAVQTGGRLLSVYHTLDGTKFWIITEADRSATIVLLPDEY